MQRVGRFQLQRELGRGAQATVWLAHDPRLDREVALKLFHPATDAQAVSHWLHEAHAVSRLTHPQIVPVFEAGEEPGPPYLVFEFVAGETLAAARRRRPKWPPREAVTLMLGVLDALAAAHAQGIVHRDLKPSNVLLGEDGRARVMDFGIAARVVQANGRPGSAAQADAGRVVGTPGYMSPEAARGEPPRPAMDVFAAGVMLGELLAGEALLKETDPWRAVQRVQHEDLVLPAQAAVDDSLRGIVQRALARDADMRYDSVEALRQALATWLEPAEADAAAPADAARSHATLEFLLRRMRHKSDFPALSAQVARILRLTGSETESLNRLAEEILQDVGLTQKLLRMVNAAHYTAAAGGGIGTVTRAVALVGIAGIRNLALSALLLEHLGDKGHAARMQHEFLRALMAGMLARELMPAARDGEEAFLAALFQNLGRLLTEYYFPEEAVQIRLQPGADGADAGELETAAARVLGIGFDELTAGVALAWGLPARLRRALQPPDRAAHPGVAVHGGASAAGAMSPRDAGVERLRRCGRSANALTDAMIAGDGGDPATVLAEAAAREAALLECSAETVLRAAQGARVHLRQLVQAMGLKSVDSAAARSLLGASPASDRRAPDDALPTRTLVAPRNAPPAGPAVSLLEQGLARVRSRAAGRGMAVNELLQLVLETMRQALDLRRAVLCLREPRTGRLTGRLGLGPDAAVARAAFSITPDATATRDLFAVLCARGADLLVANAATVAARLPGWYRESLNAPTFLLLPLMHQGAAIGLVYGDKAAAGSLLVGEAELALLRTLRDQAVKALAQGRGARPGDER